MKNKRRKKEKNFSYVKNFRDRPNFLDFKD